MEPKTALADCFEGFDPARTPGGLPLYRGKVRDVLDAGDELLITVTDRISAFDRVISSVPHKGEILNSLSLYWFDQTADIVANHVCARLSARTTAVRACAVLPVEVVVRGYLSGSAWRDYEAARPVSGLRLPAGLRRNERFERPLLTPSTKAAAGHDEPISCAEVVDKGLVDSEVWLRVENAALALFRRGSELSARRGLILVDTKYEFGLAAGNLLLVDEIHTPDSSRFWYADDYEEAFANNRDPRGLDKEYFRQWLLSRGFRGDGEAPVVPDEVRLETARRYREAYETITGRAFAPLSRGASVEAEESVILDYLSSRAPG